MIKRFMNRLCRKIIRCKRRMIVHFNEIKSIGKHCKRRIKGIYSEKIRPDIFMETLKEHKFMCASVVLAFLMFVTSLTIFLMPEKPVRYELETLGSEIDFQNPDIQVHTAADGIAVVGTPVSYEIIGPDIVPTSNGTRITSDPATIWQADASPTHGGFTLPVQMDGDSIGVLTIPDIGLSVRVYDGEDEMELMERGVAHFRHTSAWDGNVGLSAHNINLDGTPGYFLNIHTLQPGAIIRYETALGTREYRVETVKEISEMDWSWLNRTQDNRISMITCITGKPAMRLAVQAVEKTQ